MGRIDGKKVLIVIGSKGFRDEEYAQPRALLDKEGAAVTVASTTTDPATGMKGTQVKPDVLVKDASADDYDAVVFVGGNGAREYWNNPHAHALAKSASAAGKVLAALGAALPSAVLVGLAGGAGAAIGELTGYLAGYSGQTIIKRQKVYTRIEQWVKKWGTLTIFLISVVPFFFDLAGIAAGVIRFPVWKFLIACWLGRTILYIVIALAGAHGWETILRYKKEGAQKFNFGGCKIEAVNEGDPEHGVYVYKKAFGTQCVDCCSGYKILKKKTYALYRGLKKIIGR